MITRRHLFALAAAPALLTVPAFGADDNAQPKGTHVPNTSLWIEEKKIADVYGPDSTWDGLLNKGVAVFIMKSGAGAYHKFPHKGDLIERIENRRVYRVDDFIQAMEYFRQDHNTVLIDAVRKNEEVDLIYNFDSR